MYIPARQRNAVHSSSEPNKKVQRKKKEERERGRDIQRLRAQLRKQDSTAEQKLQSCRVICLMAISEIRSKMDFLMSEIRKTQSVAGVFFLSQYVTSIKQFLSNPISLLEQDIVRRGQPRFGYMIAPFFFLVLWFFH